MFTHQQAESHQDFAQQSLLMLHAIDDLHYDREFFRLFCPDEDVLSRRYDTLRTAAKDHTSSKIKYLFALDLYDNMEVIPRLFGTLLQVIKMLGPDKCAVSMVAGASKDGTDEMLYLIKEHLFDKQGIDSWLQYTTTDSHDTATERIESLAFLRNLALSPMWKEGSSKLFNEASVVVFINDIVPCPHDIYELLFQQVYQDASMACAMDWVYQGAVFYDSWVARSMSGDLFLEVPQDVRLVFGDNFFWDHGLSKDKWDRHQPLQVYSCWGGMVALASKPFLRDDIRFRASRQEECHMGEPMTLAKDLWRSDQGLVLIVPSVNVAYNDREATIMKARRGYVQDYVDVNSKEDGRRTEKIAWSARPPGQVKCQEEWGPKRWWVGPI
jgi:alpha-1,3-mannosyltransferase